MIHSSRYQITLAFTLAAIFIFLSHTIASEHPSSDELRAKMSIDPKPVQHSKNVVTSYADVINLVRPSVVSIYTTTEVQNSLNDDLESNPWFRHFFGQPPSGSYRQRGLGSGVIITEDGYILTNSHVVADADDIKVRLPALQKEFTAELIGSDEQTDVALIKIDGNRLPIATLADSSNLRVGDVVLAIGTPFDLEQSVSMGIVSALGRTESEALGGRSGFYANFIQTDAPINPGSSGGALIDAKGRLVGINTAIQSSGMVQGNIGIGFAIPSNMSLNIIERLLEGGGEVKRGYLGVLLRRMDADSAEALGREDYSGALVAEVVPASPAAKAGFKVYDIIIEFEGDKVIDSERLKFDIGNADAMNKVKFLVDREGELIEIIATLGDRAKGLAQVARSRPAPTRAQKSQPNEPRELLEGLKIRNIEDAERDVLGLDTSARGAIVSSVERGSNAAESGVQAGDVIVEVNKQPVDSAEEAIAVRKKLSGSVVMLRIVAENRSSLVTIRLN